MSLAPGSRVGTYEIVSLIGRGGMGEVYRARDRRLERDVAVKLLPVAAASDADSRARFSREARALASLSHPNIATIYGFEDNGPSRADTAIVMEFVEGETLADRLEDGALPLDQAMGIASQIADALEAAHEKGIVHRDLKPANIRITPGGAVKVLDFGLAKLIPAPSQQEITRSETMAGVIVGTPAYMAPEQVEGRPIDARADIWAFGVILYEMLSGERLFAGESLQAVLTAILTLTPTWDRIPPSVRPLLRACLERDPQRRLRNIGDVRFLLEAPAVPTAAVRRRRLHRLLPLAAGVLGTAVLAFAAGRFSSQPAPASPDLQQIQISALLPPGVNVTRGPGETSSVAVSPDGRAIAIAASDRNGQRLYRRTLDRLEPVPLEGSERGSSPFYSWDGEWIGFFADGRLKRIPAEGGAAVDIAEAPGFPAGASWGRDDRIVFAVGADSQLGAVRAEGGTVELLPQTTPRRHPEILPDPGTLLFESAGHIHILNRASGQVTRLIQGTAPRYANGQVIFSRGTTLLAAPIDVARAALTAPAMPIVQGVAVELPGSGGGRHYAVSPGGTLAYVPAAEAYALVLVDASGTERVLGEPRRSFENPRFSPDGRAVVVASRQRDEEAADLWVYDTEAGTVTRFTSEGGRAALWSDPTSITYSHLGQGQGIYSKRIDGGKPNLLLPLSTFHWLVGWTPDRSALLYGHMMTGNRSAISASAGGRSEPVVDVGSVWGGRLSRDGKWLAYYILRSGTFEVYVAAYPGGTPQQVAEGTDPAWAPDGAELYYRSGPRLMAARLDTRAGIKVLSRRVVVDPFLPPLYDDYDIHPNGGSIVLVRPANRTQGREVTIVVGALAASGETNQRRHDGSQ